MSTIEELNEALLLASKEGDFEAVRASIEQGADVNAKDKENATPLMRSVSRNYVKIVELLIAKGADVNAENDWGYTPLKYADKLRLMNLTKLLQDAGAIE